jgi:CheY-like chemotaxis protein
VRGRERVLVVDDDAAIADMLADRFRDGGARVAVAFDGARAICAAAKLRPDSVLSDLDLRRRTSGYDVTEAIRRDQCNLDAHIIAITATHPFDCRIRAKLVGFLPGHLSKRRPREQW